MTLPPTPHRLRLPFLWKICPLLLKLGVMVKIFFHTFNYQPKLYLTFCSHLLSSAFVCVPVWPRPLTWRSVCAGSWLALRCRRSWLAPRICLFLAGIQLRNRQFQAGLWRTPVSRQLCQLLDQLCGTQTSWPHPAWFALKSYSVKYQLGFVFLCVWFFFCHTHEWQGPMNRMQVLRSSLPWIYMKNSPRGGGRGAVEILSFLQTTQICPVVPTARPWDLR